MNELIEPDHPDYAREIDDMPPTVRLPLRTCAVCGMLTAAPWGQIALCDRCEDHFHGEDA